MNVVYHTQYLVVQLLGIAALGLEVFAFVDALRYREDAYRAAGKLTKSTWLGILGVAMLLGFVTFTNVVGLLGLVAVVAAGVYLADVRPALRQVTGRGRSDGPYGPW